MIPRSERSIPGDTTHSARVGRERRIRGCSHTTSKCFALKNLGGYTPDDSIFTKLVNQLSEILDRSVTFS